MNPARCPRCNSTFYSPDPSNGGAGRNKCLDCGAASPVTEWYQQPAPVFDNLNSRYGTFMQKPEPPTRAGVSSTPRAERKPAPIKQYKDD